MRHKHYTPGHFPANNNNSERFFKFILLVSVSFYHSCPGFDGMRPIENASRQVLFENNSVIFISKIRQIFRRSLLLPIRIWCQIVSLWILFEYSNFCFRQQPCSLSMKVTSKIWTSVLPFSGVIIKIKSIKTFTALSIHVLHVNKIMSWCFVWLSFLA